MRPTFHQDLVKAKVADLHHHAARERTAKIASRARRTQARQRTGPGRADTALAFARRVRKLPAADRGSDDHAARPVQP